MATSVISRARTRPAPPPERPEASGTERVPETLLYAYLKNMGSFELIEASTERRLAHELDEARDGLAKLALELPAGPQRFALERGLDGPRSGRNWPFAEMERFCERIAVYRPEQTMSADERSRQTARELKQKLDRARDGLIHANLRLVVHIAKMYSSNGIALMDLIQEGNIGLMKAVEKFDVGRGNKFSTYAYWWIKQAMDRAIADKARTIRLPVHMRELRRKIRRVSTELIADGIETPSAAQIASQLGLPEQKVREGLEAVRDAQSLDQFSDTEEGHALLQRVEDPNAESPLEVTRERQMRDRLESAFEVLDARERRIVQLRFGLGQEDSHTLEEIGRLVGLSRERVRQVEGIALRKLQGQDALADLLDGMGTA